jgi:hypothetical protein
MHAAFGYNSGLWCFTLGSKTKLYKVSAIQPCSGSITSSALLLPGSKSFLAGLMHTCQC